MNSPDVYADGGDLPPAKRVRLTDTHSSHPLPDVPSTPPLAPANLQGPAFALKATLMGHKKAVSCVKISPDSKLLVSGGADGQLLLYDLERSTFVRSFDGHTLGINDVVWSPDGQFIASASDDKSVRVWHVDTGKVKRIFHGHTSHVYCLCYNPQGTIVVSGSYDETMVLWDIKQGKCLKTIPAHSDPVSAVQYNNDGSIIASASHDGLIRMWNASTGQCIKTLVDATNPPVSHVRFSPNGRFLLACTLDSVIRLWSCLDEKILKTFTGHTNVKYCITASFLTPPFGQHGPSYVVCGSEDGKIYIWDIQTRQLAQSWQCHVDTIVGVDVSSDGMTLATASLEKDLTVKVWTRMQ